MQTRKWKKAVKPEFDREVFTILRMIKLSGKSDKELSLESSIAVSTIRKMRIGYKYGGTRYPRSITLQLLAQAAGYVKVWVPAGTQDLSKAIPFDDAPAPRFQKPKKAKAKGAIRAKKATKEIPREAQNVLEFPAGQKAKIAV